MSIDIFSGSAFNKPQTWIENRDKTIFEFEDGTLSSFSWTDDINSQKLVDAGLKSSTSTDPSAWSTHPTKIRVGEGITAIANTTFFNCNTLRSIIYPNNMLSIGSSVF